jgi:hypothetical protein
MARSVVIQSASVQGDTVTVTGTVDGSPVTVTVWLSYLNTLATNGAKVNYVAQQLAAALPVASAIGLTGTVLV